MHKQHMTSGEHLQYHYLFFDSVRAFHAFTEMESRLLSRDNKRQWDIVKQETMDRIQYGSEWYGTPVPTGLYELENHKRFLGIHLIKQIQPKVKAHLSPYLNYLDAEVMPKPKLAYNDRGLGLFSFDRAAMGLYKRSEINLATPLDTTLTQLNIELGRLALHTSVKEVYAYFKNKNVSHPSLCLYLMAGANAYVTGNEMLYVGLACSELVEFLELRNVAVEVNVLLGTSFKQHVCMGVIRVKRFQDALDKNQLLLMSSDPRYFRYRGFQGLIALSNHFDLTIPSSLGTLSREMGGEFVKKIEGHGFVFEQSYSLEAAAQEVKRIVETYNNNRKRNGNKP